MIKCLSSIIFFLFFTNIISGPNAQSVFIEGFGFGALYSLKYDLRFASLEKSGAGIRVGSEYYEDIFIIPIQVNYLIGKKGKFIEVGTGAQW
ncbi:MAG: hypothetical protein ACJA01_004280 [Saprospiraceae bacterium]|jgi:hypothetical protein